MKTISVLMLLAGLFFDIKNLKFRRENFVFS